MAKEPEIDDPELEAVKQLTRIADALETFNEILLSLSSDVGGGRVLDVRAKMQ